MADKDTRKSIRFDKEEVEDIEQEMEDNPILHGRSFSNAVRWLVKFALNKLRERGEEQQQD